MMDNIPEEFMKKLEAFMTQQTQRLVAQNNNKANKLGGSKESVDEEIEMKKSEDPSEPGQGRGGKGGGGKGGKRT
ncbi:hypothetical protein L1887_14383 [Cichorium endivia]|nr:hypothetical protein L1887_14383 [Cichorium endivia]